MKRSSLTVAVFVLLVGSLLFASAVADKALWAQRLPKAIKIVAPDGVSTKIYSKPDLSSEAVGIAINGDVFEVASEGDPFIEISIPEKKRNGFVLKAHTAPWQPPVEKGGFPIWIALAAVVILGVAGGVFWWFRARETKEAAEHAASIPASIRRAEELFRQGEYSLAIKEFNSYMQLQGGDVRNPDVFRRLSSCYQAIGENQEAAKAWEKMEALGGLKSADDYRLGLEIMMALGREPEAAQIYERLLETETNEEKRVEIDHKLFDIYRKLKETERAVVHASALIGRPECPTEVVGQAVDLLISEGRTELAIASNNVDLIRNICAEFLEVNAVTAEAGQIYLKCLEYDRTNVQLHRMLAEIYAQAGDFRRAVSELTILHQIDKEQSDQYMERAARMYVENGRVADALSEGNPLIVKKIAQIYLMRSEVNPDAVATYEKVLEFQPRAVGINKMLSTVYLTRGDLEKYMAKLRLLHEIDGGSHDYLSDLAQCIIDNDLVDETIREGNRDLNLKILKQLIRRGASDDKTVALFERLVKFEAANTHIRGALVKAYERRGDFAKCLEHLLFLIRLKPDDEATITRAAEIAAEQCLVDPVLRAGNSRLILATASRLIDTGCEEASCRPLLEQALKSSPGDDRIRSYLAALPSAEAPVPAKAPGPPPDAGLSSRPRVAPVAKAPPEPAEPVHPSAPDSTVKPKPESKSPPSRPEEKRARPRTQDRTPEVGIPERILEPEPVAKPSPLPAPEPVAKPEPKPAPPGGGPPQAGAQFVRISDAGVSYEEKAVTTFVSGYEQGKFTRFSREELFLPDAGGLAYKELQVLAQDGWGDLHTGVEVNTGRAVLMRVIARDLLDPSLMKEFVRQACEVGFNMVHDSILQLEEVATGPGARTALIHPLLTRTLEQALEARKQPDLPSALYLVGKILEGLSYAHHYKGLDGKLRRTFHLHLQPSQILVSDDLKECRIASFGYSQIYRNLTRGVKPRWKEPCMNPALMPPELFRSKGGSVRERAADVYSLGVVIHLLVTGEYPFEGPSFDDYKFQHSKIFAAPPRLISSSVPDWLESIILGCIEKEPEKRWGSVAEVHQAFSRGMEGLT